MYSNKNSWGEQWRIQDFPLGGGGAKPLAGRQPPTWAFFGKNVCENERIGSCSGVHASGAT